MIEVATKISKEERVGVDQRYLKSHFEYDNGRMIRKKGDSPGAKVGHWEWSINRQRAALRMVNAGPVDLVD